MTDGDPTPEIRDSPAATRFEAFVDGRLAGVLDYRLVATRRILIHTEVFPAFEGRGVGAALVRAAMDEAQAAGRRVTVKCPFARTWLARHPEYDDLVTVLERPTKA